LASIRQIFTQLGVTRIFSKQLVEALRALPDHSLSAPGGEGRGEVVRDPSTPRHQPSIPHHQLTTTSLGHTLRRLGICSHNIRLGSLRAKGYDLSDFTEAFARFL